jgi:hypothetical protein
VTPSLGNRVAIEYKAHGVHGGLSESTESPAIPKIQNTDVLTQQKCGRTFGKRFRIRRPALALQKAVTEDLFRFHVLSKNVMPPRNLSAPAFPENWICYSAKTFQFAQASIILPANFFC